jgi:hypothetical protein
VTEQDRAERIRQRVRAQRRRDVTQRAREYLVAWRYLVEACTAHQVEIPDDVQAALLTVEQFARGLQRQRP